MEGVGAIPIIRANNKVRANQESQNVSKNKEEKLIHVKTDVLSVNINTLGGNLVDGWLLKYPASLKDKNVPIQILNNKNSKLYTTQSGFLGIQKTPLKYEVLKSNYSLKKGQKYLTVSLMWKGKKGLSIVKTYKFERGKYAIDVDYQIKNNSGKAWSGQFYTQIKRLKPKETGGFFHVSTYNGASIFEPGTTSDYQKISYSKMDKGSLTLALKGGWVAMQQRYFLSAWIPNQNNIHRYYSNVVGKIYTIGMTNLVYVEKGTFKNVKAKLYVGPEITSNLQPLAKGLDLTIDYGFLWPISIAIFWVMQKIFSLVGNWGWSIVIITILIRLAFYKLSSAGYKASAKMRDLGPKMKAIKERYKDDRQEMSRATMELYKKSKINPISGCLPMLVQIPFLFALYYVLIAVVQLRQAHFIFWIHDLAAKDPYYILPILMGISMYFTTKLSPTSLDAAQSKMMLAMPVIFTILFASFPSGLVLYWLVNNVASLLQQWYVTRKQSSAIQKV